MELLSDVNPEFPVPKVEEDDCRIHVYSREAGFAYTYRKQTGLFEQIYVEGEELLDCPMELNIWRAPTDNDKLIKLKWLKARYDQSYARAYETSWECDGENICITSKMAVTAPVVQPVLCIETTWTIRPNGLLTAKMRVEKDMEFPFLPRFGIRLFLKKSMDKVTYLGIGPDESYVDKRHGGSHEIFQKCVAELHEDYIRPQENGSHCDCDYVKVESDTAVLTAAGEKTFAFNASLYTAEELTEKRHSYELVPCGSTVLCLDYAQSGIGSNSCGPTLLEQYQLNEKNFTFELNLMIRRK